MHKGIMTSQVTNMFCTVVCALATAARLEIKAPKKATRDVDQQMKVHALQREYCPDTDLLGQWRKSYDDIVTTETHCVKYSGTPLIQTPLGH